MREVIGRDSEPPFMVMLALWPNSSRSTVWVYFWISIFLAAGSIVYGFQHPRFFWGGLLVFAALWYLMAIKWMDRNGKW